MVLLWRAAAGVRWVRCDLWTETPVPGVHEAWVYSYPLFLLSADLFKQQQHCWTDTRSGVTISHVTARHQMKPTDHPTCTFVYEEWKIYCECVIVYKWASIECFNAVLGLQSPRRWHRRHLSSSHRAGLKASDWRRQSRRVTRTTPPPSAPTRVRGFRALHATTLDVTQ